MACGQQELEILAIRGQIATMGCNDCEFSLIQSILDDLHENRISPAVAVSMSQRVLDSKQDYH